MPGNLPAEPLVVLWPRQGLSGPGPRVGGAGRSGGRGARYAGAGMHRVHPQHALVRACRKSEVRNFGGGLLARCEDLQERARPHLAARDIAGLDDSEYAVWSSARLEDDYLLLAAGDRWLADLVASTGNGGNAGGAKERTRLLAGIAELDRVESRPQRAAAVAEAEPGRGAEGRAAGYCPDGLVVAGMTTCGLCRRGGPCRRDWHGNGRRGQGHGRAGESDRRDPAGRCGAELHG